MRDVFFVRPSAHKRGHEKKSQDPRQRKKEQHLKRKSKTERSWVPHLSWKERSLLLSLDYRFGRFPDLPSGLVLPFLLGRSFCSSIISTYFPRGRFFSHCANGRRTGSHASIAANRFECRVLEPKLERTFEHVMELFLVPFLSRRPRLFVSL